MRRGVCPKQQSGDHHTGVRELPTGLLSHIPHCLSSVLMETVRVICSCVDHQALRAPEGLLFQQLHCLNCGTAAFRQHFLTKKRLGFPLESPSRTICGGGSWQLAVWMYQEVPGCCWAGCRAERVGQRKGRSLGHWQGESVSLYLSLWGLIKVSLSGIALAW